MNKILHNLIYYFTLFCISVYAMMETTSISGFSGVKNKLIIAAAICGCILLLDFINSIHLEQYLFFAILLIFFGTLYVSMKMSGNYYTSLVTKYLYLYLFSLFITMAYCAKNKKWEQTVQFLFIFNLFLVVINDFIMFTGFIHYPGSHLKRYFIGTKFSVSYVHINTVAFYLCTKFYNYARWSLLKIILFLLTVSIPIYVDCNTGLIASVILFLLIHFGRKEGKIKKMLSKPITFFGVSIFSTLIVFGLEKILNLKFVHYFIVDILHRDISLTGRMEIYELFPLVIWKNYLWGYGYGRANIISKEMLGGYADAQNLLLQWILQVGIVPVAIMIVLFTYIMYIMRKSNAYRRILPIIALVYVYLLIGIVEITLNMNFFLFMGVIFAGSCEQLRKERII